MSGCQRCRLETEKKYFWGSFQFTIQKISPPGNLKFNYLGIFQSLKLRISMEIIHSISLKLNFTPNTLGCYGSKIQWTAISKAAVEISRFNMFIWGLRCNVERLSQRSAATAPGWPASSRACSTACRPPPSSGAASSAATAAPAPS